MSKLKRLTALILTLAMLLSSLPAALAVDVDADAAAEEAAVVAAETSAEEAAVVAAEASVEEAAAVEEETSVEEAAAVEEGTSAEEAAAVEAKASVEEGAVVEEEPSAEEETSGAEVAAVSEETTTNLDFQVYVNPLYEDVIDADDIDLEAMEANLEAALCSEDGADYLSHDEAVKVIRNYLANRTTSFTVYYYSSSAPDEYYSLDLVDDAMAHTGLSNQGDAILWDWSVCGCSQSWSTPSGNSAYYITLVYNVQYYTTTAQESWLKSKITSIVNSLGLEGKNDYEKIKAIYDYICENVDYDYDHLNDSSYTLQYTAYAALHDGASVCQGYAVLFYRMALEAGIDARVIAGETDGGSHGWNIVQLGSYYYNLDSTWDAGSYVYSYFLKCSDSFDSSHIRWSTYTTSAFQSEYPIADCDYGDGETLPDTPVLESISNVSNGVKITWSAVDGATSYYVYRKVSGSSSWSKVGPSTTTSYTSTGVTSGITYTFMVKAVNSFGVSGYDTTGKTICYLSVPAVTLSNVTGGVTITWTESAGATGGYYVYRRTESRSYTQIAKVASGTLTYTDKAASAGVRYYYMVRAYSNGYYSAYASQYITRLGTPTGIAVSNVKSGVQVTWNAVTGAASYQVWRKLSGSSSWSKVGTTTDTTYISTGVTSGNTYVFTVKAVYNSSVSAYSTTGKTICYLSEPTVTLSNATGGVTIAWTESTGATGGYYVYRRTESGSYTQIAKVASGTLTYTDKAASAGIQYYYAVQACSNGYYSSYTEKGIVRLGTPTGIAVSNVKSGVQVTWDAVTGATSYQVWRKLSGSSSWSKVGTTTDTTYTSTGVTSGNTYVFTVKAVYNSSVSAYNTTGKTIKRLSEPTITLENLVGGLTASWTSVTGAEGYKLYRRSETGSYVLIATLDSDTLTYTDKAAGAGVVYYYRVQAYSGSYTSSWTSQFNRRIGHTTLTLSKGDSGVVLTWTKSGGCTGYYIYRMNEDGSYTRVKTITSADTLTWTDTDVETGNSYTYYIRGYNGSSLGSYTPKSIDY